MKYSVEDFQDLLLSKGVDASCISLHNWEVQVTLNGTTYSVWPTTGKWRKNKANVISTDLNAFLTVVENILATEVIQTARPIIKSIKRTVAWMEPYHLVQHSNEFEKRSIMNCIGDLLEEIPRGGNIQFTVSSVECQTIDMHGRTMKATVQAQYFEQTEVSKHE